MVSRPNCLIDRLDQVHDRFEHHQAANRKPLDEAAAAFDSLGARRWQALAQARRARLAPGHDDSLTSTERRIADFVAAGQTNPEIAVTSYVSVKTVEANLTRIYRKLGLRSRVDLARSHPR